MLGAFAVAPRWTAAAATGVILGAIYMLWVYRRVILGPLTSPENEKLEDLGLRERIILAPIVLLVVFMGVYPQPFLQRMQPAIDVTLQRIANGIAASAPGNQQPQTKLQTENHGR